MSIWDDERVQRLRTLLAEGLSASQIGAQLGREYNTTFSRCAITGKAWRLGLRVGSPENTAQLMSASAKATVARRKKRAPNPAWEGAIAYDCSAAKSRNKAPWTGVLDPVPVDDTRDADIPFSQRVSFEKLDTHHCRWPIGDPQKPDFAYCGAHKVIGGSYCNHHMQRAFNAPIVRERKPKVVEERVPTFEDA